VLGFRLRVETPCPFNSQAAVVKRACPQRI
jgi:hypothetical protein